MTGHQELAIVVEMTDEDLSTVTLTGDLGVASAAPLLQWIADLLAVGLDVVVDLSGVDDIDSSGAAVLARGQRGAGQLGRRFALRHPSAAVSRAFDAFEMNEVFNIEP